MIKVTERVALFGSERPKQSAPACLETTASEEFVVASMSADASVELMPVIRIGSTTDLFDASGIWQFCFSRIKLLFVNGNMLHSKTNLNEYLYNSLNMFEIL